MDAPTASQPYELNGTEDPSSSSSSRLYATSLGPNTPSYPAHRRPRSPLNPDNQANSSKSRYGIVIPNPVSSTMDHLARGTRSSPLSVPSQSRNPSARYTDRQASMGMSRSPYTPVSKFFVTVIPPAELSTVNASPSVRSPHLRRGTLMPLYPTLGAQLYAISREYGLPSIGGLTVYLCEDGEGNLGPRIGEETWPFIWARYFDEQADNLYHDITSPVPSFYSPGHARRSSSFSTEGRRDDRSPATYHVDELGEMQDDYSRAEPSSLRSRRFPSSQYDTSSRQFMTPSPLRSARQDQRPYASSPAASTFGGMSRLPIVARIEWAVDGSRAPWWNQWLQRETASHDAASAGGSVRSPASASVRSTKTSLPASGRRSMHLAQLRNETDATSSTTAPSTTTVEAQLTTPSVGRLSVQSQQSQPASTKMLSSSRQSGQGYVPLQDDDGAALEDVQDRAVEIDPIAQSLAVAQSTQDEGSYETQSYAGYSAIVSNADDARQGSISESEAEEDQDEYTALEGVHAMNGVHAFDPHALNDDSDWQNIRAVHQTYPLTNETNKTSDYPTETEIAEAEADVEARGDLVQQWVDKHLSPPLETQSIRDSIVSNEPGASAFEDHEGEVDANDIDEVVGLWAEKAISAQGVPSLSDAVEKDADTHSSGSRSVRQSRSAGAQSRGVSDLTASTSKQMLSRPPSLERPSAVHDATNIPLLQTNSVAMDETVVEHGRDIDDEKAKDNTKQKLSLLSPIALQDGLATFSGPNADLRDFLPDQRRAQSDVKDTESVTDSQTLSRQDSIKLETPTMLSPAILSPTHLEPPTLRSPGQMSGSSSASDMSDSLIDMERALALLSPAGFAPSPNTDKGVPVRREPGSALSVKRSRISSGMSASENMARARTLSASVSPSLRFIRAGEVEYPSVPDVDLPSDADTLSPQVTSPSSGMALMQAVRTGTPHQQHDDEDERSSSSPSLVAAQGYEGDRTPKAHDEPIMQVSHDGDADKDFSLRDQWIAAQQKHLPSSPESGSSVVLSDHDEVRKDVLDEVPPMLVKHNGGAEATASGTLPKATTQYATVGVQAELDSLSRDSSQFSLVSGDATSEAEETEEGDYDYDQGEEDSDQDDAATHRDAVVGTDYGTEETPRLDNQRGFLTDNGTQTSATSHGVNDRSHDSAAQASGFGGLLNPESLSASVSDVFSSSIPNRTEMSNETSLEESWLHQKQAMAAEAFHTYLIDHADSERHIPSRDESTTTPGGEGTSTNRNSLLSNGDQWSQDGSVYDDDHEEHAIQHDINRSPDQSPSQHLGPVSSVVGKDDEEEDDAASSDAGSVPHRRSRMSTLSSHREAIENAGGLTPTFLYDRHLTYNEIGMADRLSRHSTAISSLSPISAEYGADARGSIISSKDSLHPDLSHAVDALGIHTSSPSPRLPVASQADLEARKDIVSMAGEQMDDHDVDLHMPTGFEQVFVQSPTRSVSSQSNGVPITRSVTSDGNGFRRVSAAAVNEKPLRRSMGSINEKRTHVDPEARRASASAARPIAMALPGPRRGSPRPMLTAKDGVALPIRRSISPHSPRPRFGALPPSPSLQANMLNLKNGNGGPPPSSVRYGNISSSYGSPPDASTLSPNLVPHNGFSPSLHNPTPRRTAGSPLIIDTAKAQLYESEPSALADDTISSLAAASNAKPIFRGQAASATPPSPRGPRAPPFAAVSPSAMPLISSFIQQ